VAFDQMTRAPQGVSTGSAAAGAAAGKRTLTEMLPSSPGERRASEADARGGAGGSGDVDNRDGGPGHEGTTAEGTDGGATVPTPVAVRNGPRHAPIDSGDRIGMSIAITVTSSTGRDADMARIQDSEQVGVSTNHTGSASAMAPMASSNSGFMAGHPIPDDQHGSSRSRILDLADNHGGNGSYERPQLDIYTDAAAGVTTPRAIPHSGYIIKRTITKGTGTHVVFRTEKRAAAVSVNGYTSEAGPSPTQGDDVVARA
jgi:hypothetical protein